MDVKERQANVEKIISGTIKKEIPWVYFGKVRDERSTGPDGVVQNEMSVWQFGAVVDDLTVHLYAYYSSSYYIAYLGPIGTSSWEYCLVIKCGDERILVTDPRGWFARKRIKALYKELRKQLTQGLVAYEKPNPAPDSK